MTPGWQYNIYVVCHYNALGETTGRLPESKLPPKRPNPTRAARPHPTRASVPIPSPSQDLTCQSRVMTPKLRGFVLKTHNTLRSNLANGRAANRRSGKNIYKLVRS
ncbi:unnamed protein product [Toxocara canis]|uniref:SCP domain-containing protein n=1 Tax=Toxocara canis TaxID=6265 RepID=A0A183U051_TOXCA|nr:unnamed protein product [Toxocara canis]